MDYLIFILPISLPAVFLLGYWIGQDRGFKSAMVVIKGDR